MNILNTSIRLRISNSIECRSTRIRTLILIRNPKNNRRSSNVLAIDYTYWNRLYWYRGVTVLLPGKVIWK
jgi:hypothetical protein